MNLALWWRAFTRTDKSWCAFWALCTFGPGLVNKDTVPMISSGLTGWLGIWVQSKKKAGKGCIILCVCVNMRVCVCCVVCVRMFVYCTNVRGCACLWHCVCVNVCFCAHASANLCRLKLSPPQHTHLLLRLALVFIIVCCLESIHMKIPVVESGKLCHSTDLIGKSCHSTDLNWPHHKNTC